MKKLTYPLLILVIALIFSITGCKSLKTGGGDQGEDKSKPKNYSILYKKYDNHVYSTSPMGGQCFSFTVRQFTGGGVVKRDGTDNQDLKIEGFFLAPLSSKKYEDFFYISADSSPLTELVPGRPSTNFDFPKTTLWSAGFEQGKSSKLKAASSNKHPTGVLASSGNQHLAYIMSDSKEEGLARQSFYNPFLEDTDLVIRDVKSGEEKTGIKKNYNRQLFTSFSHFSAKEDAFYTIMRENGNFKFVKVMIASGEVLDFDEAFPDFDWNKINWSEYFPTEMDLPPVFAMSPDESKILVYKNTTTPDLSSPCVPKGNYKLWSINIKEDSIEVYSEGSGVLNGMSWNKNSKEVAFIHLSCGGCYPGYIDSKIKKMTRDGKDEEELVSEPKAKINSLGWSPDEKEIAFAVYGESFESFLKIVNPKTKKVKEILSTKDTEGEINKDMPVALDFADWVAVY